MKVAFISHDSGLYGATRSLLNLIEGLQTLGISPHVVLPHKGEMTKLLHEKNIPFVIINHKHWVSGFKPKAKLFNYPKRYLKWRFYAIWRLAVNLIGLQKLIRQLKVWDADIVYTNTSVIPIGAIAAAIIKKPHVWHIREFKDLDHELYLDWGNKAFRSLLNRSAAQIVISKALHEYLKIYLTRSKTHIVPNGIAFASQFDEYNKLREEKQQQANTYTFLIMGFISRRKGQHGAIKAISLLKDKYPGIKLLVVGSGGHRVLKRMIKDYKLEQMVDLVGHMDDPYNAYIAADALLMCSSHEAFGRVTVEAMSAGLPVIGLNNAATSEIVQHEHTGLLYQGQEKELAACMEQFINNPGWAKTLGENGWQLSKEKYNIEKYSRRVYEILGSVLQSN